MKTCQNPVNTPHKLLVIDNSTLLNTNTNSSIIINPNSETTQLDIAQQPPVQIAYKSSHPNIHPKENCKYCNKLYSKHNIKTHKLKCKDKYKESPEYKLLVRASVNDIPGTYIEVRELFVKLNEDNPRLFNNLPPDESAFEEFERGLPQRGRPRKDAVSSQSTLNTNTNSNNSNNSNNQKAFKRHTTINNITNNNITNNNITQNNINVFINPVCQESIAHITPERRLYIILQRLNSFKALIDSIYEAPANHNIYISDRKWKQVKFLDPQHGVNNGEAKNIIGDIAMTHLGHLDNFIETHKQDVPEHRKNDLDFIKAYTLDENNNPKVIKQMTDKVESMHNSSKMLIDKYEKILMAEFITMKELPEHEQEPSTPIPMLG